MYLPTSNNGSKYVFPYVCFFLSVCFPTANKIPLVDYSTRSRNHNGIYAVVLRRVEVMWPIIAQRVKVPQESLFPLHLTKVYSALGLSLPRCYLYDLTWHHLPYPSVLDFWKSKFEKSSMTNWIFNLQKSISKLIFAGYTGSKNPVRNRLKVQSVELDFSNLIFPTLFFENQVQMDRAIVKGHFNWAKDLIKAQKSCNS